MTGLLLINYHYVRDPAAYAHPGIHPISWQHLDAQLDALMAVLQPATPADVTAYAKGELQFERPRFMLNFDDGLKEHIQVARHLARRRGIHAAYFICSRPLRDGKAVSVHKIHWLRAMTPPADFRDEFLGHVPEAWRSRYDDEEVARAAADTNKYDAPEVARLKYLINFKLPYEVVDAAGSAMLASRGVSETAFCAEMYMSGEDITELAALGHVVGCHGHSHRPFSRLSTAELHADVGACVDTLSALAGRPRWLSYPWGSEWSLPGKPAALCQNFGFELAVTLKRAWNRGRPDRHRLNRINTNEVAAFLADAAHPVPG